MTASLQQFTRALLTPDLSFKTLNNARVVTQPNGLPRLMRTTRFVEAEIGWQGEQWLVALPLTPAAIPHIERMISTLRKLNTDHLVQCRILPGEMRWADPLGDEQSVDLILQHLPPGQEFGEALLTEDKATLITALNTLQSAFQELEFSHNNLKESNLRWCGGRFIPIRYSDARFGTAEDSGNDTEAFESLRRKIADASVSHQIVNDVVAVYDPLRHLAGHIWTSHVFEGLVCVEDEDGFGFVDTDNNPVIATQYIWAGDFHEGRAEVQTATGMGLIDRQGSYVIPPEYEIVEYDPSTSVVHVRQNGCWALFDYLGHRITEFGPETVIHTVEARNLR